MSVPLPIECTPLSRRDFGGRFHMIARLGAGGMGEVYLAIARSMYDVQQLVVLKTLRERGDDDSFRRLFLTEARIAARLNHPNVVQTLEVGEATGAPYISMEYLRGQPLHIVRPRLKAVPLGVAARIICDVLLGLHYAHELRDFDGTPLGLVHRDLSPHNIFVTYDGVTKIVDFGIAKACTLGEQTEVGIFKGKLGYVSPEQAGMSRPVDRRADLFVLGVVFWELLAGRRLFGAPESMPRALVERIHGGVPRLASAVPNTHPAIDRVLAKAVEHDPDERFQSALEMREAIERALAGSHELASHEDVAEVMQRAFENERDAAELLVREFYKQSLTRREATSHTPPPTATSEEVLAPTVSPPESTPEVDPPSATKRRLLRAVTVVVAALVLVTAGVLVGAQTLRPVPVRANTALHLALNPSPRSAVPEDTPVPAEGVVIPSLPTAPVDVPSPDRAPPTEAKAPKARRSRVQRPPEVREPTARPDAAAVLTIPSAEVPSVDPPLPNAAPAPAPKVPLARRRVYRSDI